MTELLDTHQHLIYPDVAGYSWTDDIPALANKSFSLEDYKSLTTGKEVSGTLFMETGADDLDYKAEARFAARLAKNSESGIHGVIASCRPEVDDGFSEWLDECEDLSVLAYRRVLHVMGDDISKTETFRRNVRKIGNRGKVFDLCFRAQQDFGASQCQLQTVGRSCLLCARRCDIQGDQAICRACVRQIWERPHRMGKRLAGRQFGKRIAGLAGGYAKDLFGILQGRTNRDWIRQRQKNLQNEEVSTSFIPSVSYQILP